MYKFRHLYAGAEMILSYSPDTNETVLEEVFDGDHISDGELEIEREDMHDVLSGLFLGGPPDEGFALTVLKEHDLEEIT